MNAVKFWAAVPASELHAVSAQKVSGRVGLVRKLCQLAISLVQTVSVGSWGGKVPSGLIQGTTGHQRQISQVYVVALFSLYSGLWAAVGFLPDPRIPVARLLLTRIDILVDPAVTCGVGSTHRRPSQTLNSLNTRFKSIRDSGSTIKVRYKSLSNHMFKRHILVGHRYSVFAGR